MGLQGNRLSFTHNVKKLLLCYMVTLNLRYKKIIQPCFLCTMSRPLVISYNLVIPILGSNWIAPIILELVASIAWLRLSVVGWRLLLHCWVWPHRRVKLSWHGIHRGTEGVGISWKSGGKKHKERCRWHPSVCPWKQGKAIKTQRSPGWDGGKE